MNKNQKRIGMILIALLLLYYFYIKGNRAKAQNTATVVGGRPPVDTIIADANADTPYPNNPTLLCCNGNQMVSTSPNTTVCAGNLTDPVNGVCGGNGSSSGGSGRPTQQSTFTTVQGQGASVR